MPIRTMDATARRIVNINTGYDQDQRFTFNPSRDGRTFVSGREADCSSFCAAVVKSAYPRLDMRDPIYTGNIKTRFEAVGFRSIRYKNLAQLRAGDFVLSPGYHIEYVHSDGRMYSAAVDERGRLRGGRAGNQTGLETRATRKYVYSKGWRWILRPTTTRTTTSTPKPKGTLSMSDVNKILSELGKKASAKQVNAVYVRQREYRDEINDRINAVEDRVQLQASAKQVNAVYIRQREYKAELEEFIRQIAEATGVTIDYDKIEAAAKAGAEAAIAEGIEVNITADAQTKGKQ